MENLEKSIKEQQEQSLIETVDRLRKIEELVRMGLMPVENLPLLKRAFTSMEQNAFMPHAHRKIFYDFIGELMDLTLNDTTINRLLKQRVAATKNEEVEHVGEEVELSKAPEGMLMTFANLVKSKVRAGGKPTDGDKKLASKAKNELRRRRNVMSKRMQEEAGGDYKEKMMKAMDKFGIKSLKDLPTDKKKEFFNYLDSIHVAKHEK